MWTLAGCAALDREGPAVSVEAPTETVREAELVFTAIDAVPGVASASVSIDGAAPIPLELPPDGKVRWRLPELPDGPHELVLRAEDRSWFHNPAEARVTVTTDRTGPPLELAPPTAAQGKTLAVWVRSPEPLIAPVMIVQVMGKSAEDPPVEARVELYPVDGAWRGLRGIEISEPPGPHPIRIEASDPLGNLTRLESTVEIAATAFEAGGYIRLSKKQKEARKDQAAIDKMRAERNAAYAHPIPEAAWSGPFVEPIPEAEMSSPFGKYRSYSDGKKSHHLGLDLSEPPGTPVGAAAAGLVLVAHEQAIFGNVVVVNHGHHVATSYNHLQEISVKEGDRVDAGTIVGLLGSTGQSTGPHLHWGLEVDVVAVDPGEWLTTGFERSPWSVPE
ncbi:MAG: peptidoglycan DD-metalloendopeptidase family protein [Myxococcota bacterium]